MNRFFLIFYLRIRTDRCVAQMCRNRLASYETVCNSFIIIQLLFPGCIRLPGNNAPTIFGRHKKQIGCIMVMDQFAGFCHTVKRECEKTPSSGRNAKTRSSTGDCYRLGIAPTLCNDMERGMDREFMPQSPNPRNKPILYIIGIFTVPIQFLLQCFIFKICANEQSNNQ
jgi:hypothetical protein